MNDISACLENCFSLVFPDLTKEQILHASWDTVAAWDSLATANLISLIGEEFEIQIPDSEVEHMGSFEQALSYLTSRRVVQSG